MGNRHDVYIWDADVYGKPKSFPHAMNMAERLAEKIIPKQTANMLAFGQTVEKLLKNYDEDDRQELFLEGTAADIAKSEKAAYNMEISEINYWHLLLKILFDAAKEHSVVIFDQEAWIACVSPNTILPESAELECQRTLEKLTTNTFPRTPKQMKKHFEPLLTNLLIPHGFRCVDDPDGLTFQRDTSIMSQTLELGADWYRDKVKITVSFSGEYSKIAELKKERYANSDYLDNDSILFRGYLFGLLTRKFEEDIGRDLDIMTSELDVMRVLNLIKNLVLPPLNYIKDLKSTHTTLHTDKFSEFRRAALFYRKL